STVLAGGHEPARGRRAAGFWQLGGKSVTTRGARTRHFSASELFFEMPVLFSGAPTGGRTYTLIPSALPLYYRLQSRFALLERRRQTLAMGEFDVVHWPFVDRALPGSIRRQTRSRTPH